MKYIAISVAALCVTFSAQASLFNKNIHVKNYFIETSYEIAKYGYDSYTTIGDGLYLDPGTFKNVNNDISLNAGVKYDNNIASQLSFTQVQNITRYYSDGNIKQYLNSLQ